MIRTGLRDVPLNDYALGILKDSEWFIENENYKKVKLTCEDRLNANDLDYFTSDQYFEKIKNQGRDHDGFPEVIVAHSFGENNLRFSENINSQVVGGEINKHLMGTIEKLATTFCLKKNALFAIYPPGGYISWHNNANAPAYNFIFTWSETGDGWFKYWDTTKNEMITIQDKKGWQCKAGYFGSYSQPKESLCYHAARTDCLRMTIAFTLSMDEVSIGLQDWIIEDIAE